MAGKLIITRGLPASGKSTWAAQYAEWAAQMDEAVRIVTMDDIRLALGAIFEAGDEGLTRSVRDHTIRYYLNKGYTVISADTNLNPRTFTDIRQIGRDAGAEVEVQDFTDVDVRVCLRRNQDRWLRGDCKVPDQAIIKMHEQYLSKT